MNLSKLFILIVFGVDVLLCRDVKDVEFFLDLNRIRSSEEARSLINQGRLELMLEIEVRAFRIPFFGGARERLGGKISKSGNRMGASYVLVDDYFFCYEELGGGTIKDKYAGGVAKFYRSI